MKIKFAKVRKGAKMPIRAHVTDAGTDVFAYLDRHEIENNVVNNLPGKLLFRNTHTWDDESIWIYPGETVLIPTGLKAEIPEGYMLEVKNRGSVPFKKHLIVGSCVCDAGYKGEIFINLHNIGGERQFVSHLEKIVQLVLIPVICFEVEETTEEELYNGQETQRGAGALGSTNENDG